MSEHILKLLREFEDLPESEEKQAISSFYQRDEIGVFELCDKIRAYISEINNQTKNKPNKP